ncbi:MAG: Fis family transcriptional regulator [Gammaproteobacteria bacterium]|jgi:ribosome-associated translation inhibitor RaiA|nr:Fis family transcriptional regulator [Gammaproteobacteria bacterium]
MSSAPNCPPAIHISGDTLALDPKIRHYITAEAERLQQRYSSAGVALRIGISEEFDPARGHRVRCELDARLPGRHQLMVREAHKEALTAISSVFAGARKQLRRLATRSLGDALSPPATSSGEMQACGT